MCQLILSSPPFALLFINSLYSAILDQKKELGKNKNKQTAKEDKNKTSWKASLQVGA